MACGVRSGRRRHSGHLAVAMHPQTHQRAGGASAAERLPATAVATATVSWQRCSRTPIVPTGVAQLGHLTEW